MSERPLRFQAEKAAILDMGLVCLSLIAALISHKLLGRLWPDVFATFDMFWANAWLYIPLVVIWAVIFNSSRLYQEIIGVSKWDLFLHVLRLSLLSLAVVLGFLYAIRVSTYPRTLLFLQCFYGILFISFRAIYLQPLLLCMAPCQRILLITDPAHTDINLLDWLKNICAAEHVEIAGLLTPEDAAPVAHLQPTGHVGDFEHILHNTIIDTVIIHLSDLDQSARTAIIHLCETEGVEVWVTSNLIQNATTPISLDRVGGRQVLVFNSTVKSFWLLAVKRAMDILLSLSALVLLAPFLLLIALFIRMDSPGPAIFTQQRCTLRGRIFKMYKFRTMTLNAEAAKGQLEDENEVTGPVFKIKNDPRITRIGRILRRYSIDEFPQLINVLKGDMSIVGPRPPIPAEVAKYENWQRRRLSMRAGCTCLWQIGGRNNLSFEDWMRLDLQYIDNWSIGSDVQIILKTFGAIFRGTGF